MTDKQFYLVAGGVVALAYFLGHKIVRAADGAVDSVTPTNPDNIFYRGVNAVGDVFDDGDNNDSFTLGGWLYDLTHSDEV